MSPIQIDGWEIAKLVSLLVLLTASVRVGKKWGRFESDGDALKELKQDTLRRFEVMSQADTQQAILHARTSEQLVNVASQVTALERRVTRLEDRPPSAPLPPRGPDP